MLKNKPHLVTFHFWTKTFEKDMNPVISTVMGKIAPLLSKDDFGIK